MSCNSDLWDNAVSESIFKTLKSEAIFGISLLELNSVQRVLFEWIETNTTAEKGIPPSDISPSRNSSYLS
jgi:hypothetical protein